MWRALVVAKVHLGHAHPPPSGGFPMRALLQQTLVFTAALLLALPQGWCCFVRALGSARAEVTRTCCADPPAPAHRTPCPNHDDGPAAPVSCCCHAETALPVVSETSAPDLTSAALLPAAAPDLLVATTLFFRAIARPVPPIPARLLHCVWLC